MKKTAVYLLLCIAMTLSGCTRPAGTEETEKATEAVDMSRTQGKFGIATDYSGLIPYKADWEVKSYYFDEPLSELVPDEGYGTLLPYVGDVLYDAYGEAIQYKYGLCTAEGEIITKPVYSEVTELYYYPDDYTNYVFSGMISISKRTEDGTKYAVAAADGSWITDFIYDYAYCTNGYAIADTYGERAIIAPDGGEIYPTVAGDWISGISEGYGLVLSGEDSMCYFINISGERVLGPFEEATSFSEGVAAVKDESCWSYIDKSGNTVLDMGSGYIYCGAFINGYAPLRYEDGGGAVIGRDGNVLFDRELHYMGNGIWYNDTADYSRCYYDGDADFTQITYKGSEDIQYTGLDCYFYLNDDGGAILFKAGDDNGIYIEGNNLILHKLSDNTISVYNYTDDKTYYGVIDMEGNFLIPLSEAYGSLLKMENDGTMIFHNGKELKKSDGTVIVKNCVSAGCFEGTDYIRVQDKYSSGYITTDGEWILRVSLLNSMPD